MDCKQTLEIEEEIILAQIMADDLEKLWKSYAKKAFQAKQERETKQAKRGFLEYETVDELINAYGYGDVSEDVYNSGLDYFEMLKQPPKLSIIEKHRANIRDLKNRYLGTVKELQEELDPIKKIEPENIFDKMAREERNERYKSLL